MRLKGNLRRIKHPSNRLAVPVPTSAALASLTDTAAGVTICRPPTRPGTPCANSPTMAGRAARPGRCTPACDRHQAGQHGRGGVSKSRGAPPSRPDGSLFTQRREMDRGEGVPKVHADTMQDRTVRPAFMAGEKYPPGGSRALSSLALRLEARKPVGTVGTVGTQAGNPSGARLSRGLCCSHSQFT